MERVTKQSINIVAKIDLALQNFSAVSEKLRENYAIKIHNELAKKKKFFFFKSHKTLPEPHSSNLEKLLEIGHYPLPPHLDRLGRIGIQLANLGRMAEKASKMPNFLFAIPKNEVELIDAWSKNKSSDESSFSPYCW